MDKDKQESNVFDKDFYSEHYITAEKNPAGGVADGLGFTISWNRGELKFNDQKQALPNGAFPHDVIDAVRDRLKFLQGTKYKSEDIKKAIKYLSKALTYLQIKI